MKRMFQATILLFVVVSSFIMLYAILGEPLGIMIDAFMEMDSETTEQVGDTANFMNWLFGATCVFGVIGFCIVYAVYAHKKEFEQ